MGGDHLVVIDARSAERLLHPATRMNARAGVIAVASRPSSPAQVRAYSTAAGGNGDGSASTTTRPSEVRRLVASASQPIMIGPATEPT